MEKKTTIKATTGHYGGSIGSMIVLDCEICGYAPCEHTDLRAITKALDEEKDGGVTVSFNQVKNEDRKWYQFWKPINVIKKVKDKWTERNFSKK